jgi:hypothetical protein
MDFHLSITHMGKSTSPAKQRYCLRTYVGLRGLEALLESEQVARATISATEYLFN